MEIIKYTTIETDTDYFIHFQIQTSCGRLLRHDKERLKAIAKQKVTNELPYVTISYAYPHVIIWYSMQRNAVDIECYSKIKASHAGIFTNKEDLTYFKTLFRDHSEVQLLTTIWTWKEAVGKYYGVGMKYGYQTVQVVERSFRVSPLLFQGVSRLEYLWGVSDTFAITMIRSGNPGLCDLTQLQAGLGLNAHVTQFQA